MTPQNKEFASLLFTPRTADKQGQPDYRGSRTVTTPTSGRASAGGFGRFSSFRESAGPSFGGGYNAPPSFGGSPVFGTPTNLGGSFGSGPGRKRSLTPTGSLKDFVPPPTASMFDSPTGPGSQLPQAQPFLGSFGNQTPLMHASAGGTDIASASQSALVIAGQRQALQMREPEQEYEGTWVTVFGVQPADETMIMQEFGRCGDIVYFGSGSRDAVNWIHIEYANKYQARRALAKNGELLNGRLMIGVNATEPRDQPTMESMQSSNKGGELRTTSKPLPARPYLVPSAPREGLLAQPSETTWTKVSNYILGL